MNLKRAERDRDGQIPAMAPGRRTTLYARVQFSYMGDKGPIT